MCCFPFRAVLVYVNCGIKIYKCFPWDFLDGPAVKSPLFQCRGHRFDPWLGKFCMPWGVEKKNLGILYIIWRINYIGNYQL